MGSLSEATIRDLPDTTFKWTWHIVAGQRRAVYLSIAPIQMGRLPFLQGAPEFPFRLSQLSFSCEGRSFAAREPNKAIAREIS
jgi:hypothetical protein